MPVSEDGPVARNGFRRIAVHVRAHVIAYTALAVAVTGTSYAAFDPVGSDGDVDLCVNKKTGAVSIQKGKRCKRGTVPVAVNAEGLVGPAGQAGAQGPPGADGKPGARGATGPAGQRGATGQQGTQGTRGATGTQGATGSQGPAGTATPAPEPPPDPYNGSDYRLSIDGGAQIPLTSFAGCRDKSLGVEYQDCYFETASISHTEPIFTWLDEVLAGEKPTHDLTVTQYSGSTPTRHIDVSDGFLSGFRIEDLNASDASTGHFEFVVVPEALQVENGGAAPEFIFGQTPWRLSDFYLDIDSVDLGIAGIRNLEVTVPKVLDPVGSTRTHFAPGTPDLSRLTFEIPSSSAGVDLDNWVDSVSSGGDAALDGTVFVLNSSFEATKFAIELSDLLPTSDLEPFAVTGSNRRTITLDYSNLSITVP
jgi:hypothetical protein